jgi:hypothetical protein
VHMVEVPHSESRRAGSHVFNNRCPTQRPAGVVRIDGCEAPKQPFRPLGGFKEMMDLSGAGEPFRMS